MMLRSPVMGQRMFTMPITCVFNTAMRKLNEFAILIQARLWTSQVAWTAHYPLALKAGLPQAVADDLKVGKAPGWPCNRTKPPCTISARNLRRITW